MAKKQKITTEDLARMVQGGFNELDKKVAKKADVDRQFKEVNEHFDKIEKLILADHKRRIERLEQEVKDVKNLLAAV